MVLKETHQRQGGNSNIHLSAINYFPVKACPLMLIPYLTTIQ